MRRRSFVRGLAVTGVVGIAGCTGDSEDDERTGRGTIIIENRSGDSVRAAYGLLEADTSLDVGSLGTVQLTVDGDTFEAVYTGVTGGPYRFVVALPDTDREPVEQRWDLEECIESGVTARVFPDALNISGSRCVQEP